jgi:predicted DCC family thiol-disulfide oxidoreductase YuxK
MHPAANAAALLFYDGLCGFCNATVQLLLKHDKHDRFRFAAQQSAFAQELLVRHGISQQKMLTNNSVYLVLGLGTHEETVLQRSNVSVQCLFTLGGIWKFLGYGLHLIPPPIRDWVYTLVAKNRFRLAGRYDSCPIPTAAQREKFFGVWL